MVHTACILHNFLLATKDQEYVPVGYGDAMLHNGDVVRGMWRDDIRLLGGEPLRGRNWAVSGTDTRLKFVNWFSNEGVRHWQDHHILRTA